MTIDRSSLERLAARYRRRRQAALLAASVAVTLAAFAVGRAVWRGGAEAFAAGAGAAAVAASAWIALRRPATAGDVARHLDRVLPEAEESAELLLADERELSLLGRLERQRVARALDAAPLPPLPDRLARRTIAAAAVLALLAAVLLAMPSRDRRTSGAATSAWPSATRPPVIERARITVTAPGYTGIAPRTQAEWDVETVAGAAITWRIATDAATGRLVTSAGDTIPLLRAAAGTLGATVRAEHPMLYQVTVERGPLTVTSDFHRLGVADDVAPAVTIARPSERTTLTPGGSLRVPVEVHAGDDYGVGGARLIATVTSGEGEAVRFREQAFALTRAGARPGLPHGVAFRTTLDLGMLGLKPGDELYFHAEASDRRAPTPNIGRSETVFLSIMDTARVALATLSGMAVRLAPEAFRSQRQIIIDTERLIADRSRIAAERFRDRSNDIGLDQGLLRGRYGALVGDESETGGEGPEGHQHDMAENATLLAASVKAKLKAALAQMWEAELRLRTYRPADALPYEYRALELLKQMQQDARVYVQRTGVPPTPLDPAQMRLTGKLDAIASRSDRDSIASRPSLPAIRAALVLLQSAESDARIDPAGLAVLERAEAELAPLAAADARHLDALRATRSLATHARDGAACPGCVARAARGLWLALPPAVTRAADSRAPAGPLARDYFDRLETIP